MKRWFHWWLCALLLLNCWTVSASADYTTQVETVSVCPVGERLTVQITLTGPQAYQAAGVQLRYDAAAFSLLETTDGYSAEPGTVQFAAFGNGSAYTFTAVFLSSKEGNFSFYAEDACLADTTEWEAPFGSADVTVTAGTLYDCNGDGTVDTTDLLILKQTLAGLRETAGGMDVNRDGLVDTLDLTLLKKKLAGLL